MAGACDWLSPASSPSDWLLGRAPEAGAALAAESPLCLPGCTLPPARAAALINRQRHVTCYITHGPLSPSYITHGPLSPKYLPRIPQLQQVKVMPQLGTRDPKHNNKAIYICSSIQVQIQVCMHIMQVHKYDDSILVGIKF